MGILNFIEEIMDFTAIKHRVVEPTPMNMKQMLSEVYYLLKTKKLEDNDLIMLNYTIIDGFEVEQCYKYSKNFARDFEDKCLKYLIPLYVPFTLRFVIHQKYVGTEYHV